MTAAIKNHPHTTLESRRAELQQKAQELLGVFMTHLMPKESPLMDDDGGLFSVGVGERIYQGMMNEWMGQEVSKGPECQSTIDTMIYKMNEAPRGS